MNGIFNFQSIEVPRRFSNWGEAHLRAGPSQEGRGHSVTAPDPHSSSWMKGGKQQRGEGGGKCRSKGSKPRWQGAHHLRPVPSELGMAG